MRADRRAAKHRYLLVTHMKYPNINMSSLLIDYHSPLRVYEYKLILVLIFVYN